VYPRIRRLCHTILFTKGRKFELTNSIPCLPIFQRFLTYCQHFHIHNIFITQHYGFREGLSTINATYKLTEIISNALDNHRYIAGVICYLTKVFDCVSHKLFLKKLQFFGVRGLLLEWFKSYLYNRKKRVELKFSGTRNYSSSWKTLESGVPQGLVLGTFLFKIYINDFLGLF
jgi:hypothetical protein